MGPLGPIAALLGAAFLVACVFQPRKGAQAAVVLALMVTIPVWATGNRVLRQPHPQAQHAAVDFATAN